MKKFQKIFIIPVLFVCAMLALAGCEFSFGGNTAKVSSIELTSAVETAYNIGDTFDAKDAQIRVKYDDDTTKIVDIVASTMISGFDTTKTGNRICVLTYSKKTIEISYSVINTITFGKYHISKSVVYVNGVASGAPQTAVCVEDWGSYWEILINKKVNICSLDGVQKGTLDWTYDKDGNIVFETNDDKFVI